LRITKTRITTTTTIETQETQSQEKFAAFNMKQQRVVFLELNCKEGKKT
jgi:hypothetical protein